MNKADNQSNSIYFDNDNNEYDSPSDQNDRKAYIIRKSLEDKLEKKRLERLISDYSNHDLDEVSLY